MSFTATLPNGFEYVGASLLSTVFLLVGQNIVVSRYRKRAGIAYPQLYAEKAEVEKSKDALKFNCAQRAHQNTLEYLPIVYTVTILSGFQYPIFSASALASFVVGRIAYTKGYITGDPTKRSHILSRISSFALIGQLLASTYIVGGWLYSGLGSKFF